MTNTLLTDPGRRLFLKAGAAAICLTIRPGLSFAQANIVARQSVGAVEVTTVSDGKLKLPMNFLLPETKPEDIEKLFADGGLEMEPFATPAVNVAFIRHGAHLIAIDCGAGSNFMEGAGKLPEGLAEAGIGAEDVTHVVFTHAHPDHLWGAIDDFEDVERFPNAKHIIASQEWDYWTSSGLMEATPESNKGMLAGTQRILKRLEPRLERVDMNAQIVPGVNLMPTPGHTPAHCSVMIEDGHERLLVLGDTLSHHLVSFQKPDWVYGPDIDPDTAIATRRSLLAMLAADQVPLCGYHLPAGGFGHVEHAADTYRLVSA